MKPSAFQWLLCLGMLVAGLGTAGWLQADRIPELPVEPTGPVVTINPAGLPPDTVPIQFRYHDFAGSLHRFNCHVDGSFIRRAEDSFGLPLDQEVIFDELDRRLAEEVAKKAGPLARYARIEVSHEPAGPSSPWESFFWKHQLAERLWDHELPGKEKLPPHLRAEARKVEDWIGKELPGVRERIFRDYYKERGFDFGIPSDAGVASFAIAYKNIADEARPMLADCFDKFVREAGAADDEEILSLLLAAMQEMPFQFPRIKEGDLYTAGFWIPTQVLKLGLGDCDSKAGTFCGLWQRDGPQIFLWVIDVPEEVKRSLPPEIQADQHAFLAIEALPGLNDQEPMTRGLRKYVPYEVVRRLEPGLTKVRPGEQLFDGFLRSEVCMTDDCYGSRLGRVRDVR